MASNSPVNNNSSIQEVQKKESSTPALDAFGRDLTAMARDGILDPVIGRKNEIDRTVEILMRKGKNNPVLIGEAGVGKTAIVEGLAQRIANGDYPIFQNSRIIALDITQMVAGTMYRGQFEERLKAVMEEVRKNKDIILFIDELHTVVGAGGAAGSMDLANIIKPALARGELQTIGATTLDEYRKYVEKDAALARRFQPVLIGEPTADESKQILCRIKERFEHHHQLSIPDNLIELVVTLADRYLPSRRFPDKAIDLLDEAGSRAQTSVPRPRELRVADVYAVISQQSGVPLAELSIDQKARLLSMEEWIGDRVIGQNDAIKSVAQAVRRNSVGLGDPNRPVGSFAFVGPTGVGKTELAKTLAEFLFGNREALLQFDMSEYMEKGNVSRLIGAPPGYIGFEDGGQLTEAIRRKPRSVVLFDEIEKAHPDVQNILLQILEEGTITDSRGRKVDCSNILFIMTSNVGVEQATTPKFGFQTHRENPISKHSDMSARILQEVHQHFRPELLNRFDKIIVFKNLGVDEGSKIVDLEIAKQLAPAIAEGYHLEVSPSLREEILKVGFSPEYGARQIRRAVGSMIIDRLSEAILSGAVLKDVPYLVDVVDNSNGKVAFVRIESIRTPNLSGIQLAA